VHVRVRSVAPAASSRIAVHQEQNQGTLIDVRNGSTAPQEPSAANKSKRNSSDAKKQIGNFFCDVYSYLFNANGQISENYQSLLLVGSENHAFAPDFAANGLFGHDYVEVKAANLNTSKQLCRKGQAEDYAYALLRRIDHGDESPSVRYAFFRYGSSHGNLNLHLLSEDEAGKKLAESTRDLLVVPFNLALLMFSMSAEVTEENSQVYFTIGGKILTMLHSAIELNPRKLVKEYGEFAESDSRISNGHRLRTRKRLRAAGKLAKMESLCLDDIAVTKRESEGMSLRYSDTPISRLKITIFSLKDEQKWQESFSRDHWKILHSARMRDLYQEDAPPF